MYVILPNLFHAPVSTCKQHKNQHMQTYYGCVAVCVCVRVCV